MHIVEKIENYDPDYLEMLYSIQMRNCEQDKDLIHLIAEKKKLFFLLNIVKVIAVCLAAYMLGIVLTGSSLSRLLVPCAFMLMLAVFVYFASIYYETYLDARNAIVDSYISPAVLYHRLVNSRQCLACYGKIVDDNFVAFFIARTNDDDKCSADDSLAAEASCHFLKRITFHFDGTTKEGVLTLDVGNEVVYYSGNGKQP